MKALRILAGVLAVVAVSCSGTANAADDPYVWKITKHSIDTVAAEMKEGTPKSCEIMIGNTFIQLRASGPRIRFKQMRQADTLTSGAEIIDMESAVADSLLRVLMNDICPGEGVPYLPEAVSIKMAKVSATFPKKARGGRQ